MSKKKTESIEKTAQNMGSTIGARKKAPKNTGQKRPERGDAVSDMMLECTLTVRDNIKAIMEVEEDLGIDDPLTYNQLGKLSGYSSSIIYQSLTSEPPRNNIGIQTLARYALALGVTPHILLMPNEQFRRELIPSYRLTRSNAIKSGEIKSPISPATVPIKKKPKK